jgi:hypothetical protein
MPRKTKSDRMSTDRSYSPAMQDRVPEFQAIRELATSVNALHKQMAAVCAPIVREMIRSRLHDQQEIERMLDSLLDCACIPDGLELFRSLCRYYFSITPVATADYVHAYRDLWDSENHRKREERSVSHEN